MAQYRKEGNFEKPASTFNGILMLLALLGLVALMVYAVALARNHNVDTLKVNAGTLYR